MKTCENKRGHIEDPVVYENGRDAMVVDLRPEGVDGLPVFRMSNFRCGVKGLSAMISFTGCARIRPRCRRSGRYEEVAKRTGLDWRTVKKYVEEPGGTDRDK